MGKGTEKLKRTPLAALIKSRPQVLEVLHRHGVHFCAGCYLTLSSPPERAAAYHAVPDVGRFLKDLGKAIRE